MKTHNSRSLVYPRVLRGSEHAITDFRRLAITPNYRCMRWSARFWSAHEVLKGGCHGRAAVPCWRRYLLHAASRAARLLKQAVEFEALNDAEFVLGSAAPHAHALVLGYYSVHTTPAALRDGEAHIGDKDAPRSLARGLLEARMQGLGCCPSNLLTFPPRSRLGRSSAKSLSKGHNQGRPPSTVWSATLSARAAPP
jgi:hypothetical protein